MQTPAPRCTRCGVDMQRGKVRNAWWGDRVSPRWIPDHPSPPARKSIGWTLSSGAIAVIAYRCPSCKSVELFAPDER